MICPSKPAISLRWSLKRTQIGGLAGSTGGKDFSPPLTWRSCLRLSALRPIPRLLMSGNHHQRPLPCRIIVFHLYHTNPSIVDPPRDISHPHRNRITRTWARQVNRRRHSKLLSSKHRQPNLIALVALVE